MMQECKNYTLAIISNYPIEGYLKKGYDYLFSFYNPLGFFKTVYFFEPSPSFRIRYSARASNILKKMLRKTITMTAEAMGRKYTLYIHRSVVYEDVREIFVNNKIDCIRVYEMFSFDLAERLSKEFEIPLVVSIH